MKTPKLNSKQKGVENETLFYFQANDVKECCVGGNSWVNVTSFVCVLQNNKRKTARRICSEIIKYT